MQSGSATVNSENGEIIALGMGKNQVGDNVVNYATDYYRQPGSTSKPVLDYAPAIEYLDWSTAHVLDDSEKVKYTDGPEISNANGQYKGKMTIAEGAQTSRNTIALSTFQNVVKEVGINKIYEFGISLGFRDLIELNESEFNEAYSIGGWNIGTTPLELAGAYATFSNKGIYNEPHTIRKISIDGNSPLAKEYGTEFIPKYDTHTVMGEDTAYIITDMLDLDEPDAYYFAGTYDVEGTDEISGKTGTSDWGNFGVEYGIPNQANRDNWIVTYTPDVVTAVWQGYPSEAEKQGEYLYTDLEYYKLINQDIMDAIVASSSEDYSNRNFTMPPNVESVKIKKNSWPPIKSNSGQEYMFIKGSEDYKKISTETPKRTNAQEDKVDDSGELLPPNNVSIVFNEQSGEIEVKWDEVAGADSYVLSVNNYNLKTKDPGSSINLQEFVDGAGCSSPYKFDLVAVKEENNKNIVSKTTSETISIDFSQSSYCKV
jgi:penicillin-binding protein 1A